MKKNNYKEFIIRVKVSPGCQQSKVVKWDGETLKIRVQSPPVKGAANQEAVLLLAQFFALPKRDITLLTGETSGYKRFMISGISKEEFDAKVKSMI